MAGEDRPPPATPTDAFRQSVLDSIQHRKQQQEQQQQQQQQPTKASMKEHKSPKKRKLCDITSTSHDNEDSQMAVCEAAPSSLLPPPNVRRASSATPLLRSGSTSTTNLSASKMMSRKGSLSSATMQSNHALLPSNVKCSDDNDHNNNRPLIRRRSSLFDSLPGRKSRTASLLQETAEIPETRPSRPPSFLSRLSQSSTLLADDLTSRNMPSPHSEDDSSLSSPSKRRRRPSTPRGSLFGAVMEKLGGSSSAVKMPPPRTPQRDEEVVAAPGPGGASPCRGHDKPPGFMSPSGKSIMNIFNTFVMHSPFRFSTPTKASNKRRRLWSSPTTTKTDKNDDNNEDDVSNATPKRKLDLPISTPSPSSKGKKRTESTLRPAEPGDDSMSSLHDDENWKEATIGSASQQAEILDWTLREQWQMECHPPERLECLMHNRQWRQALQYWRYAPTPTSSESAFADDDIVKPKASSKEKSTSEKTILRQSSFQNKMATDTLSKGNLPTVAMEASLKDPELELAARLIKRVKNKSSKHHESSAMTRPVMTAETASLHNQGSCRAAIVGNATPQQQAHIREWQQSFRSLFLQWRQRCLERAVRYHHLDDGAIATAMQLENFFYGIAHDHVVLFRVDLDVDADPNAGCTPRILLSACDDSFVQALRALGVESTSVLNDPIQERFLKQLEEEEELQRLKAELPMSPTVKADLEALRKAQAFGEVAGADVSIKIKAKAGGGGANGSGPEKAKPLAIVVTGQDDADAFFEVYFNRLGQVVTSLEHDRPPPKCLPQLVCPWALGPFWHASLESVQTRPIAAPNRNNSSNQNSDVEGNGAQLISGSRGIVELAAPIILPSVLRQLVAASASILSKLHHQSIKESNPRSADKVQIPSFKSPMKIRSPAPEASEAVVAGSQYVVFHAIDRDHDSHVPLSKVATTMHQLLSLSKRNAAQMSLVFNCMQTVLPSIDSVAENEEDVGANLPSCKPGKALQLIVWDVSRSNVVACKMGTIV